MNALSIFGITGWILAGLGSTLILLGFLANRIVVHTAPHCAKCKYPLADVPSTSGKNNNQTTCPECGRVPKNHTETYTMRSKRWCIPLGILLFAAALLLPHTNSIRKAGWTSALPISTQIDLWPKGDPKLRKRIYDAHTTGNLSTSQTTKLHSILKQALANPKANPQDLASIMHYLRVKKTLTPIFTEQDCAEALLHGSDILKSELLTYIDTNSIPKTQELRNARRVLASSSDDSFAPSDATNWLISYPSEDHQDKLAIQNLITSDGKEFTRDLHYSFDQADPIALQAAASVLESKNQLHRFEALKCIESYIRLYNNELPQDIPIKIAQCIEDPVPSVRKLAIELLNDLPESVDPYLADRLTKITDPDILDALIYQIIRRHDNTAPLASSLATISKNTTIPLTTRLAAANAYFRIRNRTVQPENMWPAYEALIQTLVDEDYTTNFLFGQDIKYHCHNLTSTALSRYLINNNVAPHDLESWFDSHPAVSALLRIWKPLTFDSDLMPDLSPELQTDPIHRFNKTLINASQRHPRSYDNITNAADEALELYFPSEPSP